jgi:HTH-type transcriptional repressor of NAD biosynthesis genes
MSIETQGIDHIKVIMIDETDIPPYPEGSSQWCRRLLTHIPDLEVIFGGETEYEHTYMKYLPGVKYDVYDYKRSRYPVSGTEVRSNYLAHWDYMLGSARAFFCRRVLLTGTESCGKTTATKYLAKIFHTSWSEEEGRYYSEKYLGGNEDVFTLEDFSRIAHSQMLIDEDTMKNANRVCFFDTDAVITQFYCELYLGQKNGDIEKYVDPMKYDAVFLMSPEVEWVPDGLRFVDNQSERERLHEKLRYMYLDRGFKNIIDVTKETYIERLDYMIKHVDAMLKDRLYMSRY